MKKIFIIFLLFLSAKLIAQNYIQLPMGNSKWLETTTTYFGSNTVKSKTIFSLDTTIHNIYYSFSNRITVFFSPSLIITE